MTTDWIFPTAFSSWRHGDGGAESAAVDRVLRSNWLTMGPETEAFEQEIAEYHGRKHAIAVNSGSSANLIAVGALSVNNYIRSVRVPAIAWATTYAPFIQLCTTPDEDWLNFEIMDVADTWNASLAEPYVPGISRYEWPDVEVICSILGNPIDFAAHEARKRHPNEDTRILEDNCEALGARTQDGRLTGTFGLLSTCSGFYSHQLSAIELGWILTDDDNLARLCRLLRNHGNAGWGAEDFERSYDFKVFGYNVRPVEMHCAIAREQLKKLDMMIDHRRRNLADFAQLVTDFHIPITPQRLTSALPSPFDLAFECESREARARLVHALRADGIDCRLPTGGSFVQHVYGKPWRGDNPTPRADQIHDCGIFLGNAPWPIPELIEKAVKVMRETL